MTDDTLSTIESLLDDGDPDRIDEGALRELHTRARTGDASARYLLAWYLELDRGPSAASFVLLRLASDQGHADAQNALGSYLIEGTIVPEDVGRALDLYLRAARGGSVDALDNLANYYAANDVPEGRARASEFARLGVDAGSTECLRVLGELAEDEGDEEQAVLWLRRAALRGDTAARTRLASCYETGRGAARSPARAYLLLRWAAEDGDADAQISLADYHSEGRVGEADTFVGAGMLRRYALAGNARAWSALGDSFRDGKVEAGGDREAVDCYMRGACAGDAVAMLSLGFALFHGRGCPVDCEQAARWYESAARAGVPEACFNLALCYRDGEGVDRDEAQAVHWLREASALGHERASRLLAEWSGGPKD